jgi:hypothetical protein
MYNGERGTDAKHVQKQPNDKWWSESRVGVGCHSANQSFWCTPKESRMQKKLKNPGENRFLGGGRRAG